MKRDFLKNLGIEDKEIIDKILDENSSDIGRAKGDLETAKNDLAAMTKTYETLKTSTQDYESLKDQIITLTNDKATLQTELNTKVTQLQKSHAIESGVRDAKAKNVKAVMALLDMDKITFADGQLNGISEQLETLQKGEDTSFLFSADTQPTTPPSGAAPANPPSGAGTPPTSKSLSEAIGKAFSGTK